MGKSDSAAALRFAIASARRQGSAADTLLIAAAAAADEDRLPFIRRKCGALSGASEGCDVNGTLLAAARELWFSGQVTMASWDSAAEGEEGLAALAALFASDVLGGATFLSPWETLIAPLLSPPRLRRRRPRRPPLRRRGGAGAPHRPAPAPAAGRWWWWCSRGTSAVGRCTGWSPPPKPRTTPAASASASSPGSPRTARPPPAPPAPAPRCAAPTHHTPLRRRAGLAAPRPPTSNGPHPRRAGDGGSSAA